MVVLVHRRAACSVSSLGGERPKDLVLLGSGLETTVTVLGGSVDELDVDLLGLPGLGDGEDGLSEGDGSLASAHDATLEKDVVLVDLTVMGEATKRSDVLGNSVGLSGGVVLDTSDGTGTNAVDLLVELSSAMVAELTTAGDRPLDGGGMPGTDTGDLTETSMRLSVQSGDTESLDDTTCSLTAGNTDGIDALGVLEDLTNADLLLEVVLGPVDLVGDGTTVDLDLHDVSLVLAEAELADLSGAKNTHSAGVLLDAVKIAGEVSLGGLVLVLAVDVLGESLLLGLHPVLVETALDVVVQVLGEHGGEGAETAGGLSVADNTDDLHGRALNDGGGVDDVLLDGLLTLTTLLVLDDVGHAGLVAHEGGKVNGLAGVVTGEGSYATAMMARAALGKVGEGAAPGVLEFSMRHARNCAYLIMINIGQSNALFGRDYHSHTHLGVLIKQSRFESVTLMSIKSDKRDKAFTILKLGSVG